ncbi:hypothetical protein TREMEDRAFT_64552 [Tremella mesenterica DSM 1558]|uniref:uncharacterized protein n=1 Tax=Tremella mesenterica (strain ATCC 24925 / CBS 8224 / DSM 1558 / NBRC 9311 / NRRL Y-6157 / RJB 2259-6 / UBC 559-6) TaxID=578456 RepID=UPI0003F48FCC|nr:uncharacterized protein TREMEDRAFT_64552 [Tremella mesenterica DSM 1558]EIW67306.1 hypothetical protein TREMEDRAFT_64552 [Tremella mesenterica DSM 1558]
MASVTNVTYEVTRGSKVERALPETTLTAHPYQRPDGTGFSIHFSLPTGVDPTVEKDMLELGDHLGEIANRQAVSNGHCDIDIWASLVALSREPALSDDERFHFYSIAMGQSLTDPAKVLEVERIEASRPNTLVFSMYSVDSYIKFISEVEDSSLEMVQKLSRSALSEHVKSWYEPIRLERGADDALIFLTQSAELESRRLIREKDLKLQTKIVSVETFQSTCRTSSVVRIGVHWSGMYGQKWF